MITTLTTIRSKGNTMGQGTMYLPVGNRNVTGINWYKDTITTLFRKYKVEQHNGKKLIEQQNVMDMIIADLAVEGCIRNVDFSGVEFFHLKLKNLTFENCSFKGARFYSTACQNLVFRNCDFEKADIYDGFTQCDFYGCNFMEAGIYAGKWQQCLFEENDFSMSRFRRACFHFSILKSNRLKSATFDGCYFPQCTCDNNNIDSINITMGGARSDEVEYHRQSVLKVFGVA